MSDETTTTEAAPPPPAGAAPPPPADETTSILAALRAEVDSLKADKAAATAAADEARKAAMTDAERVADERAALDGERKTMIDQARADAASKLGIYPKALSLVPEGDPRTPEGAKALADWAKENPEFVKAAVKPSIVTAAPEGSALEKLLAGKTSHPYMSAEQARALLTQGR